MVHTKNTDGQLWGGQGPLPLTVNVSSSYRYTGHGVQILSQANGLSSSCLLSKFKLIDVFVGLGGRRCIPWHMCGVREQLLGDNSFQHMRPGDQTQGVRLGGKHLLSHFASPSSFSDFFENLVQTSKQTNEQKKTTIPQKRAMV